MNNIRQAPATPSGLFRDAMSTDTLAAPLVSAGFDINAVPHAVVRKDGSMSGNEGSAQTLQSRDEPTASATKANSANTTVDLGTPCRCYRIRRIGPRGVLLRRVLHPRALR